MAQRYVSQRSASRRRNDDNYNRLISQGYYQYGSQAHQVQPEPEFDDDYEEEIIRRKRIRKARKPKKAAVEFSFGLKKKTSFMTYAMAIIISTSAVFCLIFMAVVVQKKLQVNALKADLKEAKQNNAALQATIYDGYDLIAIENIATTKLKMMKPEQHQIVRVSAPEQSFIMQYQNNAEPKKDNFSFSSVYNMIFEE